MESDELIHPNLHPRDFKLILTDPDDKYMMNHMEPRSDSQDAKYWRQQILRIADQADRLGTVYFYKGIIWDSVIIADPYCLLNDDFSDAARARVDTAIPVGSTSERFSYRVIKK